MKNRKTSKIIAAIIMSMILVVCLAVGISASANDTIAPEITAKNIEYGGTLKFLFATDPATVGGEGKTVYVNIYGVNPDEESANPLETIVAAYEDTSGTNLDLSYAYVARSTLAISAVEMGKEFYITAECDGVESKAVKYSVFEYLNDRLYKDGIVNATEGNSLKQKNHYINTYNYGMSAQDVTGKTEDYIGDKAYVYIKNGAGIIDGATTGVYTVGDVANLVYSGDNADKFVGWTNELTGEVVNADVNGSEVEISKTAIFVPKFRNIQKFTDGSYDKSVFSNGANSTLEVVDRDVAGDKALDWSFVGYNSLLINNNDATENFNCVVFETDVKVYGDHKQGCVNWYFYGDTLFNGDIVFRMDTWRVSESEIYLALLYPNNYPNKGDANYPRNIVVNASENDWFNLRIEYYVGDRGTTITKFYVNDNLEITTNCYAFCNAKNSDGEYRAPQPTISAIEITTSSSITTESGVVFDNFVFEKINKEVGEYSLSFDMSQVTETTYQ